MSRRAYQSGAAAKASMLRFETNPNLGNPMRHLLAFVSLCLLSSSALAIEPPREKDRWTTLAIDELTVYSSADDATTRSVASDLVRLRGALSVVTKLKVRSPLPTRVFIFGDRRAFAQYAEAAIGRSENLSGVFLSDRDGNHVLISGNAAGVDRVVYHELTHYFLRNTVSSHVPLWFNEGLAEFYSTFSGSKDTVDVGRPVDEHLTWLRTQPLIPLKDLFAITHDSKEYHEGNRQGVFYAESWALVHYLMIGNPERRNQLGTYVGLIASGKSIDDAFHAAFHGSYDDLERELRKYIRAFSMNYIRYTMADLKAVEIPAPQPLPRDTQLVALAGLLMHANTPRFGEAESFLNAALKSNPSSAAAYAELGVAKSWQRQNAEAETNFDEAVQLGSRDAETYILYGQSILRRIDASVRHNAGAPSADVMKARELFRRASELNPSSAAAFSGLGVTYTMATDDPLPGIEALERSLALAPAEVDAIFNVILLDARAGRRGEAAKHLDALARLANAETVRQARENLFIADLNHAGELLRAGKEAEGTEIMKRVAAETTNEQLKAQIEEQLASAGHVDAANRQISDFQRAVNKANDGKFKEALAMIDALLPAITEPELLSAAKDFRAKVTEYIAATKPKQKK
jgi:Flp pilus assembly protein TadD